MCLRMYWREVYVLMGSSDRMNIRVMVPACISSLSTPALRGQSDPRQRRGPVTELSAKHSTDLRIAACAALQAETDGQVRQQSGFAVRHTWSLTIFLIIINVYFVVDFLSDPSNPSLV